MSEWNSISIKELVNHRKGYAFKSSWYNEQGSEIIVRVSDTTKDSINISACHRVKKELVKGLNSYTLKTNDVIIATVGSWADNPLSIVGKVIKVPSRANGAYLNQNAVRLRANHLITQSFLYYSLKNTAFSEYLLNNAQGSANQASITLKDIFAYTLLLPPLAEQKAIVSVLSSLDEKIDLLHRQNKTLESMASTLFRQWFIKEGQDDWVEGTLSSIASNVRENVTKQNISSEALYVGLEHIDRRNIALLKNGYGSDVDSNKSKFSTGDILFGKLRPYFHKVCTAPFDGICSTDILVIRPKNHNLRCFCLFAFFQDEVIEFANIASGGTRMPRIDWTSLANYPISLPPDDKLNDFEKIVSIKVRRINFNVHKIKNLENLRDTLLPKLMSGEVRVQYAEEAIASVA